MESSKILTWLMASALFFLCACAPVVKESGSEALMKIAESERAISAAQQDCRKNPLQLSIAERKLGQARLSYAAQQFQAARRLAEQATTDAALARTQAALEQAEQYADSLQKSNADLKAGLRGASER